MAYITQADLVPGRMTQNELVELTDDASSGEVDVTVVAAKIAEAEGLLDSFCGGRYTVPLVASAQVKGLALDIAVHKLFERRRRVPEAVAKSYDAAMSLLRRVADGKATLDQAAPNVQSSQMDVLTVDHTDAAEQDVFDDEKLEGF